MSYSFSPLSPDCFEELRGQVVKVVRGRKIPIGTVAKCFWVGCGQYGWKVGLALDDTRDNTGRYANVVWCAAYNVVTVEEQGGTND